jgi:hypothetical protein
LPASDDVMLSGRFELCAAAVPVNSDGAATESATPTAKAVRVDELVHSWKGASLWLVGPCAAEERGAV